MTDEDKKKPTEPEEESEKDESEEEEEKAEPKKAAAKKAEPAKKALADDDEDDEEEKSDTKTETPVARDRKSDSKVKPVKKGGGPKKPYMLAPDNKMSSVWKTFAGLGALGAVGSIAGYFVDPKRFAFSYLFGFMVALTFGVGSMMFVLIQRIVNAAWSVTVRRTAEFFSSGSVVFIVLVIPVILSRNTLFAEWLKMGEHGTTQEHAQLEVTPDDESDLRLAQAEPPGDRSPGVPGQGGPHRPNPHAGDPRGPMVGPMGSSTIPAPHRPDYEAPNHHKSMASKSWYLNEKFFLARAAIYVLFWAFLGTKLLRDSTAQDETKDLKHTIAAAKFAPLGIITLVLSFTFAAFDWMMSLEPSWYSTIFGVNFFASSILAGHVILILTLFAMNENGLLQKEVNVEHYHDLGKLQFGFLCFWAYIAFSQFMLIWYAAIPEETTFYHHRWGGVWTNLSYALIGLHFIVPFFFTVSRNIKRRPEILRWGSVLILFIHIVEMYWFVMPYAAEKQVFQAHWIDLACLAACTGTFLAVGFYNMTKHPIIPVGDPRLARSLAFKNV